MLDLALTNSQGNGHAKVLQNEVGFLKTVILFPKEHIDAHIELSGTVAYKTKGSLLARAPRPCGLHGLQKGL